MTNHDRRTGRPAAFASHEPPRSTEHRNNLTTFLVSDVSSVRGRPTRRNTTTVTTTTTTHHMDEDAEVDVFRRQCTGTTSDSSDDALSWQSKSKSHSSHRPHPEVILVHAMPPNEETTTKENTSLEAELERIVHGCSGDGDDGGDDADDGTIVDVVPNVKNDGGNEVVHSNRTTKVSSAGIIAGDEEAQLVDVVDEFQPKTKETVEHNHNTRCPKPKPTLPSLSSSSSVAATLSPGFMSVMFVALLGLILTLSIGIHHYNHTTYYTSSTLDHTNVMSDANSRTTGAAATITMNDMVDTRSSRSSSSPPSSFDPETNKTATVTSTVRSLQQQQRAVTQPPQPHKWMQFWQHRMKTTNNNKEIPSAALVETPTPTTTTTDHDIVSFESVLQSSGTNSQNIGSTTTPASSPSFSPTAAPSLPPTTTTPTEQRPRTGTRKKQLWDGGAPTVAPTTTFTPTTTFAPTATIPPTNTANTADRVGVDDAVPTDYGIGAGVAVDPWWWEDEEDTEDDDDDDATVQYHTDGDLETSVPTTYWWE